MSPVKLGNEYSKNLRVRTYIFVSAANKVVIFWGNVWQFRLSRFLISVKETRLLTTRKIKKLDFGLYIYTVFIHNFTLQTFLFKVHEANYSTSCKPVFVVGISVVLSFVITVW